MVKVYDVVSLLVLTILITGIAVFSAPFWILLFPLRFAAAKVADASVSDFVPQMGFRRMVTGGIYAGLVVGAGVLYTAVPGFASLVNGIGIAIGLLPGGYF